MPVVSSITGEEMGGAAALEQLHDLVSLENKFHSVCGFHRKPCNMFCFECRGEPICPSCKFEHNHSQHADKIIQVYNATHKKAVLERDVAALIDTSQIQKLINNGHTVLYIRSRRHLRDVKESIARDARACMTCVFSFPPSVMDHGIKFCSINCMVRSCGWNASLQITEAKPHQVEDPPILTLTKSPANSGGDTAVMRTSRKLKVVNSFRKRPRKQVHPHRSPLA